MSSGASGSEVEAVSAAGHSAMDVGYNNYNYRTSAILGNLCQSHCIIRQLLLESYLVFVLL